MAPSVDVPLWLPRVGALAMTWAWSIIAFGTAINAVVKSNQDKTKVRSLALHGADVNIDDGDVFKTGAVIAAVTIVIFVLTTLYLLALLLRPTSFTRPRFIAIQGGILAFFAIWLFAALVPYTHFFRTRSAVITATLNGTPIPQSVVQLTGTQHGLSAVYKDHGYLRLVAILPWITLLFTIIASVLIYMAASQTKNLHRAQPVQVPDTARASEGAETTEKVDSPTEKAESPAV